MTSKQSLFELHQQAMAASRTFAREARARVKPGMRVTVKDWDGRVKTATIESVSDVVYFVGRSFPSVTIVALVKNNPNL